MKFSTSLENNFKEKTVWINKLKPKNYLKIILPWEREKSGQRWPIQVGIDFIPF